MEIALEFGLEDCGTICSTVCGTIYSRFRDSTG